MSQRSDVSPSTLGVERDDGDVLVEYLDGRVVRYRGPPEEVEGSVRCQPGKEVQVLLADPEAGTGVMVYVNDRRTHDEILESTGVGRVLLEPDASAELFPGVRARLDGHAVVVEVDAAANGRVFVFEEDALGERAYELR